MPFSHVKDISKLANKPKLGVIGTAPRNCFSVEDEISPKKSLTFENIEKGIKIKFASPGVGEYNIG